MKDINEKAEQDELNKACEEIGGDKGNRSPRKFIPVPKPKKK